MSHWLRQSICDKAILEHWAGGPVWANLGCLPPSAALAEITEMVAQLHGTMIKMENFQKLHELKKDLIGIDNLVIPGRVSSRCWSNAHRREQQGTPCMF